MEYKHINDCWNAIENAKSKEEVEKLFEEFPRWSGDWTIYVEDGHYTVENMWYGEDTDTHNQDTMDLDIPLDEEDLEVYYENGIPQF